MRRVRRFASVILAVAVSGVVAAEPAHAVPPPNDNFASAEVIAGASGTVTGTTVEATGEIDEPFHGDRSPAAAVKSIWYSWTAPASGPVRFDTCAAGYDTTLAGYVGAAVASLTVLAANDDSLPCGPASTRSVIGFVASNGATYRIAVDGFSATTGAVTLAWAQPPPAPANDNFASPVVLSSTVNADIIGASIDSEAGEPVPAGSGGRTVWFNWTSGNGARVRLTTCQTGAFADFRNDTPFDTVLGVYTGAAVGALTQVAANNDGTCPSAGTKSVVRFRPSPATLHRVQLSGSGDSMGHTVIRRFIEPAVADFTADAAADKAIYRPGNGQWIVLGGSPEVTQYGATGDIAVPADYTGDGRVDRAIFRPSTAEWSVAGVPPEPFQYGQPCTVNCPTAGDVPVPGDYDGNGVASIAIYRPTTGQWFNAGTPLTQYGVDGDQPVPGDYNGDGDDDIAIYRPSTGQWFVLGGSPEVTQYGVAGDLPIPGDYDGDGDDDIAIFRPSTGQWFVRGGAPEVTQYGALCAGGCPVPNDIPEPGDFDGDGDIDKAIYRRSTGQWFVRGGAPEVTQYGAASDVPLAWPWAQRRNFGFTN